MNVDIPTELSHMRKAAEGTIQEWTKWHMAHACRPCHLILPLGELFNPALTGFFWGLFGFSRNAMPRATWSQSKGLEVQAIEGQVVLDLDLVTALLMAQEIPEYRCQIVL